MAFGVACTCHAYLTIGTAVAGPNAVSSAHTHIVAYAVGLYDRRQHLHASDQLKSDVGHLVEELGEMQAAIIVACSDNLVLCGDLNCGATSDGRLDDRPLAVFTECGLTHHYVNGQ